MVVEILIYNSRYRGWCDEIMSKEHVGLRAGMNEYIHSIKLDSGYKYDRYMAIAYLRSRDGLPSCLAIGSLEVDKVGGGREFFNPCKFYSSDKLFEAILHMLSAHIAFTAVKRGVSPRQVFIPLLDRLRHDSRLHEKLINLSEGYYKKMVEIEGGGSV